MPPKTNEWWTLSFNFEYFATIHIEEVSWTVLHVTISVQQYLSKCNIKIMPYPPCSADFISGDFCLLLMFKEKRSCPRQKFLYNFWSYFSSAELFEVASRKSIRFCFEKWIERCDRCISSEGRSFKKNYLYFVVKIFLDFLWNAPCINENWNRWHTQNENAIKIARIW